MAERPSVSRRQNAAGLFPPGTRQLIPMIATGSTLRLPERRCCGCFSRDQMAGNLFDGREIPDQCCGQWPAHPLAQVSGKTDSGSRVEPVAAERFRDVDGCGIDLEVRG